MEYHSIVARRYTLHIELRWICTNIFLTMINTYVNMCGYIRPLADSPHILQRDPRAKLLHELFDLSHSLIPRVSRDCSESDQIER